jgi:ABC-type antimicrobial peptide transport system permease subunit
MFCDSFKIYNNNNNNNNNNNYNYNYALFDWFSRSGSKKKKKKFWTLKTRSFYGKSSVTALYPVAEEVL